MQYTDGGPRGHCRRCAWLLDELTYGNGFPLPTEDGVPLDFSAYPAIGPVVTFN